VTRDTHFIATRRGYLGLAAGGAALAAAGPGPAQTVRTSARIVILGAGAAGTGMANRLARRLEGAQITVIDGQAQHWYQPGFTLIAAGLKPASCAISRTTDWAAALRRLHRRLRRRDRPRGAARHHAGRAAGGL
jgi:sulfide:quinone oxidoreductase